LADRKDLKKLKRRGKYLYARAILKPAVDLQ